MIDRRVQSCVSMDYYSAVIVNAHLAKIPGAGSARLRLNLAS